jgi:hypothetical protein
LFRFIHPKLIRTETMITADWKSALLFRTWACAGLLVIFVFALG